MARNPSSMETPRSRGLFGSIESSGEEDFYHEASQFRDDDER